MAANNKLTKRQCDTLKGPKRFSDGGGLYLQVTASNTKSWLFRWGAGGKNKIGLGPYPEISLADARDLARECRKAYKTGINPRTMIAHHARSNTEHTFLECTEKFIEHYSGRWKDREKSSQRFRSVFKIYAYPSIGHLSVSEIDIHHILQILRPIWYDKTDTASRLRSQLERVLNFAKTLKLRDGENPAQWSNNLENILPPERDIKKVRHRPAMPYEEMGEFMVALRARGAVSAKVLEFAILTAARPGEAIGLTWDEVQEDRWVVPAERYKTGKAHAVPLSKCALSILDEMRPLGGRGFVFPGYKKENPYSDMVLLNLLTRMGIPRDKAVPHGFRSTFKDWAGDVGG